MIISTSSILTILKKYFTSKSQIFSSSTPGTLLRHLSYQSISCWYLQIWLIWREKWCYHHSNSVLCKRCCRCQIPIHHFEFDSERLHQSNGDSTIRENLSNSDALYKEFTIDLSLNGKSDIDDNISHLFKYFRIQWLDVKAHQRCTW